MSSENTFPFTADTQLARMNWRSEEETAFMMKNIFKSGGAVIDETSKIVSIVTFNSSNKKTGMMWQIWHLVKSDKPTEAIKKGLNHLVCGSCPLQGDNTGKKRTCYVNLGQAPRSIYEKWTRGGYPAIELEDLSALFNGQAVRFGAYGNPSLLPIEKVRAIVKTARMWTGYIHDWETANRAYSEYFMASVQTLDEYKRAKKLGYRTFRVVRDYSENLKSEITCVSDSHNKTCLECGLCAGYSVAAKDITIRVHGSGKTNLERAL